MRGSGFSQQSGGLIDRMSSKITIEWRTIEGENFTRILCTCGWASPWSAALRTAFDRAELHVLTDCLEVWAT
uniref:Uncharacterized protein n=1 Tax=uncultured prokaryote TaxID=198431 RepID=A0A0H5QN75_9ZZZZ|nr:hypothetical protein [uncultured prokaryote]